MEASFDIVIIGGGAAGFMAAIVAAEANPDLKILILEKGREVLEKVKISGGGRCNITHDCPDPGEFTKNYPRGAKELLGVFTRFGQKETVEWFRKKGVLLKAEKDGRIFPISDDSQTIVDCFLNAAQKNKIEIRNGSRVVQIENSENGFWKIVLAHQPILITKKIMVAAGSNTAIWQILEKFGHHIIPPVPSLFTFNTKDERLQDLAGVSMDFVKLKPLSKESDPLVKKALEKIGADGSLLITHWGLSGFGILKLSAWGARLFNQLNYQFELQVNFLPDWNSIAVQNFLTQLKKDWSKKQVGSICPFEKIPNRLWKKLTAFAIGETSKNWADLSKPDLIALKDQLLNATFRILGKSAFKEEFVTAGGVDLREVNFQTFESRLIPNLYLAGEVLDIDAVTGGFNFQAAWSGGWHAGKAMGKNS